MESICLKNFLLFLLSKISSFFFILTFSGIHTDFFVIFLQSCQIFSCFWEFTFFHTFSDIPMDESSFSIHKIEFVIKSGEDFSNSSRVGNHANSSHDFGQITTRYDSWRLIVNSDFESGWGPIDELDGSFSFDGSNGCVDIFWYDITSVHHGASHVFSVSWVTFCHHIGWFERRVGDFSNGELFVIGFLSWDNRGIRWQHEMDTRIRDQVGLEFSNIDIKGTIKSKRGSKGRNNLGNKSVQVGVSWSFNIEGSSADIVDGFIV